MVETFSDSVGRYQIMGEVGSGSSGTVYKCFDPILKRDVAVKVPPVDLASDELQSIARDFYHEAEIGAQFHHANIITVYDVGGDVLHSSRQDKNQHSLFLVMELANGINLKDYLLQHQQLPVQETLKIIFECCKALDYMHFQGIAHRDIKPANIIYDPQSKAVKVTDFSISDYQDNPPLKQVGTLPYSSPEHFLPGAKLSYQSDIFALGSVMYQLLTGVCPFQGTSVDEVASKIVSHSPRPIREFRDDASYQVEFIVLKAMSKLPRDRFQNMVEFTDAVSLALKTPGVVWDGQSDQGRSNSEVDEYLLLRNNSWFSEFSPDQIDELVRSGSVLNYEVDECIIHEGDLANSFYILLEGQAAVIKGGKIINQLNPGACFGELGQLTKASKRTVSILAAKPAKVLVVATKNLLNMSAENQAAFYKAFLTITMERLVEKNLQSLSASYSDSQKAS